MGSTFGCQFRIAGTAQYVHRARSGLEGWLGRGSRWCGAMTSLRGVSLVEGDGGLAARLDSPADQGRGQRTKIRGLYLSLSTPMRSAPTARSKATTLRSAANVFPSTPPPSIDCFRCMSAAAALVMPRLCSGPTVPRGGCRGDSSRSSSLANRPPRIHRNLGRPGNACG